MDAKLKKCEKCGYINKDICPACDICPKCGGKCIVYYPDDSVEKGATCIS